MGGSGLALRHGMSHGVSNGVTHGVSDGTHTPYEYGVRAAGVTLTEERRGEETYPKAAATGKRCAPVQSVSQSDAAARNQINV